MMHTIFDRFASARTCLFAAFALAVSFAFAAPGKPENVAATTDMTDGIRLTWNAVDGASYYIVYRYGGKTAQTGLVQQKVTARNWLDTSCEAGANITYRVRAFDSSDDGGAYSAYVRGYRKVLLEPYVGGNVSVNPLANGGAAQPLKVRCNVDWTAKASDWIHLNSGSYERSNEATELGFSLEPNTTGAAREGTITVYAGQESKTLKVIQGAVEVPEYDTWCGDSALAIIEDAAFPEELLFRTEYTGGFLSYADETATGGSCLRSSPMDIGGSAVISWTMPSAWKLRFRWRKDSSKSADSLRLYAGSFDSSGKPNLASATILATCSSTEWTYTEVTSQSASGAQALFFVYEKKSGGTSGTASGFGFIDDFLLMTAPRELSFARPVRLDGNGYSLNLPCDSSLSVATEVTFSHMLTYGGTTRSAKGYVYPTWRKVTSDSFLIYGPGSGEDAKNTVFSSRATSSPRTVEMEATYEVAGVSVSELLTVNITPPALDALDLESGAAAVVNTPDWLWTADDSAENGSCVSCPVPSSGDSRSFSIRFSGTHRYYYTPQNLFSFNYKLQSLGSGEVVVCTVDGSPAMVLPATGDTDWHRITIYIPDSTQNHEVTWTYSKSGSGTVGSGVSIDFAKIEEQPTSIVVDNKSQTIRVADYAVSEGYCGMSVEKGADWMSAATPWVSGGSGSVQLSFPLEFSITANGTGNPRGGKLKLGGVDDYLDLYVVQSSTADTTVSDFTIQPQQYSYDERYTADILTGDSAAFTASFTLGGVPVEGFTDLEWRADLGENVSIEDGVLTVGESDRNAVGDISCYLGEEWAWLGVNAHPPLSVALPDGLVFDADGWWGDDGYDHDYDRPGDGPRLITDIWGDDGTEKTLTATVTGPAVFKCGRLYGQGVQVYIDGVDAHFISIGSVFEIPEGEHELRLVYTKSSLSGFSRDYAALGGITLTPLEFDRFELRGPASITSGETVRFELFKIFKDPVSGFTMEAKETIHGMDQIDVTATDERTPGKLIVEQFGLNGVNVTVPFAVQWEDTITCTVSAEADGTVYEVRKIANVVPANLQSVLDSNIAEVYIPVDGYSSGIAKSLTDSTAVGGSCMRLTSYSIYNLTRVAIKVLDGGTVSFNYRLHDQYFYATLRVLVDGVEQASYESADLTAYGVNPLEWHAESVVVSGAGPHVVEFVFRPGDYQSIKSYCDLDNVQWTPAGATSRISGATVTGPARVTTEEVLSYSLCLDASVSDGGGSTSLEHWNVTADEWKLQCVSGDSEALSINYTSDTCEIIVEESVAEESVFTVIGRYAINGSTYEGRLNVTVPRRVSIAEAIFDSGSYDNCWPGWNTGWTGSYDDHSAGTSCAKSSTPELNDYAGYTLRLWGAGTLEFDWKVSCANGDVLEFRKSMVDEGTPLSISGTDGGWQHVVVTYTDDLDEDGRPVERECFWRFAKNTESSAGYNCGFIDNVTWSGTTLKPIEDAELTVRSPLAPGETAPVEISFYRYDKDWTWIPATDENLPTIESIEFSDFSDVALEDFVSYSIDRENNVRIIIDADCNVSGTFDIEAKYTLYNTECYAYCYSVEVDKDATPPVSLLGARGVSGLRSLTAMAANGVNTVGECYTAGLDPDDPEAKLTTYVTISNGVPYITWSPNLPDRTYVIQGKASLSDPQWTTPTNSTHRFFRVEVKSDK